MNECGTQKKGTLEDRLDRLEALAININTAVYCSYDFIPNRDIPQKAIECGDGGPQEFNNSLELRLDRLAVILEAAEAKSKNIRAALEEKLGNMTIE